MTPANEGHGARPCGVLSQPRHRRRTVSVPARMALGPASIIAAGAAELDCGWRFAAELATGIALALVLAWVNRS